jgi:hypothetical protein
MTYLKSGLHGAPVARTITPDSCSMAPDDSFRTVEYQTLVRSPGVARQNVEPFF